MVWNGRRIEREEGIGNEARYVTSVILIYFSWSKIFLEEVDYKSK